MIEYNTPEKGCKWYFAPGMNYSVGPTDAAGQNFEGSWDSLIRECIQNSLDAVLDKEKPVVIRLEFCKMTMKNYQNFFNLGQHIDACLKTFPTAKRQYGPMLDYFEEIYSRYDAKIGYLKISDFNTTGMAYDKEDDSCNFSAFVRGLGVHGGNVNANGRGGSFGLGKSTIYMMSPIRTMLISTTTENGQYVFEGVASLTTHNMDGERLSNIGYYDNQGGQPITEKEAIPNRFLRHKEDDGDGILSGTDIYVMGRTEDDGDIDDMIKSVLTHYWLSIYKGKLIVELINTKKDKITLDKGNLDKYMLEKFPSSVDNARSTLNPRPYYNCVVNVGSDSKSVCIKKDLPQIGAVELYLCKNSEARTDRIAFFRLPCMMVMRRSSSQLSLNINNYGVYGVFVCVNSEGDKLLKELENPAHDEWNEKNWCNSLTRKVERQAHFVMDELRDFLAKEIEDFCKVKGRTSLKMLGAGKYLYTIHDMVEQDESDVQGSVEGVLASDRFADEETSTYGAYVDKEPSVSTPSPHMGLRPGTIVNETGGGTIIPKDEENGTKSTMSVVVTLPKKKKNRKTKRNTGGDTPRPAVASNDPASVIVPIDYKVYANKEKDHTVHNVCININQDVESARITFSAKGEDGKIDDELYIVDANGTGTFNGMELKGVPLRKGDNLLKICFNDKTKHVLDINVRIR